MRWRLQLAGWAMVAAGCSGRVDDAEAENEGADASGDEQADVDLPPPWNHGPQCEGIEPMPGARIVARRDGANISLEASRDPISCTATAQSLCTGADECYGHPINTLRFPTALEPGVHDLQELALDGQAELSCSACEFVGTTCALQGSGWPPPAGTLVIEDVTDERIRGCIRDTNDDVCFAVAFDAALCE